MTEKPEIDPFGSSEEEQTQKQVFLATFSMLAKLTSIDGKVSKDEIQIIDRFMKEVLKLTPERRKFAIQIFNDARRQPHDFDHYASNYAELMKDRPKMREWMMDVLLRVSLIDKEFSGSERHLLEKARDIFRIPQGRFEEMRARYMAKPKSPESTTVTEEGSEDPFKVLRISAEATDDEVVAAYRRLSVEYGPSRIIELGLPEEFVQLAEKLYADIQAAYKMIKQNRDTE